MKRIGLLIALFGLALLGFACSSSDSNPLALGPGQGQLTVNVHDQANLTIDRAWVTFDSVQAIPAGGGAPVDVAGVETGVPIDLATLVNGATATLAQDALPAGDYSGLQITISDVLVVLSDGSQVDPLQGLGPVTFAISVSFTVEEGQATELNIDFQLDAFQFNGTLWTFDATMVTTD